MKKSNGVLNFLNWIKIITKNTVFYITAQVFNYIYAQNIYTFAQKLRICAEITYLRKKDICAHNTGICCLAGDQKSGRGGSVLLVAEIVLLVISTSSFSLSCQILAWIRVRK